MKATILAIVALAFSTSHALAVSLSVKLACKDDYFAHCSHHAVGTPGVRKCMRDVGPRLSSRCLGALADAGMIKSKSVAKKYQSKTRIADKPAVRKKYAKRPSAKSHVASKRSVKQRYASKPSKKRMAKKEEPSRSHSSRKHVAYIDD
ncbi:hypothetical protein [Hyphomicrobium sp. CS1GBMeth3]|uniref:hypothetical protein n=1 Tax=Hyphomicrobium sp. CS1GBMeth3 TaxID=1892845 RepID=UPI000930CBE6|nr:hypothetical protein [Hyphomicrobium sp. CS1GBMeth3]